jgi:16S rRNA (cytosine1402-N4)-methyltransferase
VKEFFRIEARDYDLPAGEEDFPHLRIPRVARGRFVTRKAILPTEDELRRNPRSRSAQLRALVKL